MIELIDRLSAQKTLTLPEWTALLTGFSAEDAAYAAAKAQKLTLVRFGNGIFFRGIIEFTNYCRNDCFYCGLRCSAKGTARYRLNREQILACCRDGYAMGYRTFVLQGGEDPQCSVSFLVQTVKGIKALFPDVAVTLSVGELSYEGYAALFAAGADRYLLRHETADPTHYGKLHPAKMSYENRMQCLRNLKKIGFQTGCGMMVGSPYQTAENLANDMLFIQNFKPHMIGIGPFRPHHDTPFRDFAPGSNELTLFLISLCRIMQPQVLLPATTALDCCDPKGRQKAILAGANVIMPNLSPKDVRKDYLLYDSKPGIRQDAAENLRALTALVEEIGYRIVVGRGDYETPKKEE